MADCVIPLTSRNGYGVCLWGLAVGLGIDVETNYLFHPRFSHSDALS